MVRRPMQVPYRRPASFGPSPNRNPCRAPNEALTTAMMIQNVAVPLDIVVLGPGAMSYG